MEKIDIEVVISTYFILNMKPTIIIVWWNRQGKFFEFTLRISNEYFQDLIDTRSKFKSKAKLLIINLMIY